MIIIAVVAAAAVASRSFPQQLAVFLRHKSRWALKANPKMFYNFWFECLLGCVCVLKQVNVKVFLCFEKHLPSQKIIKKIIKEEPKKKEKPKRKENKK